MMSSNGLSVVLVHGAERPAGLVSDRMIVTANQRFMAERMQAHLRSYPVDHTPIATASFRRSGRADEGDRRRPRQ
jgi:hypothetical protein